MTFILLCLYTFSNAFMGSRLSVYQCKHPERSQIDLKKNPSLNSAAAGHDVEIWNKSINLAGAGGEAPRSAAPRTVTQS